MKKLTSILLLAAVLLTLLAGCGQSASLQIDPAALAGELAESDAFSALLSPIDVKIAANLYGVDAATIAESGVYCSTGATAEEIAVFKCVDEAAAKALVAAAQTRLDNQAAAYAAYAPTAVPAIENAYLRQEGVYVFCVVAEDDAAAETILAKYIK